MRNMRDIKDEVRTALDNRKFQDLKNILASLNEADIAELLNDAEDEEKTAIFRMLSKDTAANVFADMDSEERRNLVSLLNNSELSSVVDEMEPDEAADLLEEMPASVVSKILAAASGDTREKVNALLKYPDESAGSVMTTEYVALEKDTTSTQAIAWIREHGDEREDIYNIYVISEHRRLLGVATIRELLLDHADHRLEELMEKNVISVKTTEDQETAARLLAKYNFTALPVVDNENRLVGIITVDDAVDVLQDESSEDFEKMAAMVPQEDTYFTTSVWGHAKNRLPWLLVLMLASIATGVIIEKYEDAFSAMPVLVALMPMLMDTGGNAGTQTSTLIIRGMAVDEIRLSDFLRVFWKEFRISIIVGVILGGINGLRVGLQYGNPMLGILIFVTLILDIVIAKLTGACLPMLVKKLGGDPAIIASPLLTTAVDVSAVWIYFEVASRLLHLA